MKRTHVLGLIILISTLLPGCGLKKMVARYPEVTVTLDNPDLENKGGEVSYTVKGVIPPKYLNKKATMTFTPTLSVGGTDISEPLTPITVKGQKADGEGKVISYKEGGAFTSTGTFKFKDEFETADITVPATARQGKKQAALVPVKNLGYGIANTGARIHLRPSLRELAGRGCNLLYAPHNYSPEFYSNTGTIYFEVNMSNMNWNLPLNRNPEARNAMGEFVDFLNEGPLIDHVVISGWASPEGEESNNQGLSERRFEQGKKWFNEQYEKYRRKYARRHNMKYRDMPKPDFAFENNAKGEDWNGFETAVAESDIDAKSQILNVVKSQPDNDLREQKIREMTDIYPEIAESILPPLRRVEMTLVCKRHETYSDSELIELVKANPAGFSANERLYAASGTGDLSEKEQIYSRLTTDTATENDWRAYNNLGIIQLHAYRRNGSQEDLRQGLRNLSKAAALAPDNGIVLNNMAIAEFLQGNTAAARTRFEESQNASENPVNQDYALGMFSIADGNYAKAAQLTGNPDCDYNTALTQLLNKDYTAAKTTLDCIEDPDAPTFYLKAVLAARMKDESRVYENLKQAVKADSSLKTRASKDAEFKRYRNDSTFKNIVR